VQALHLFLTLETDALPQHPLWKRAEEEECIFHSFSVMRRQHSAAEALPAAATAKALSTLSTNLFVTMRYIGSKVCSCPYFNCPLFNNFACLSSPHFSYPYFNSDSKLRTVKEAHVGFNFILFISFDSFSFNFC
jgi:hypothetical protein